MHTITTSMGVVSASQCFTHSNIGILYSDKRGLLRSCDSKNLCHSAKATYSLLRRWGEWRRYGPTDTS
eukprot:6214536-Pleurochrysis_carterae.AAC.2